MKSLTNVILKNARRKEEKFGATKREKLLSVLAFGIVFFSLALVMVVASIGVTIKLDEINQTYAFVNILLLMSFFILFTKSVFESLNVLYFSKDLKILFRMPLKAKDILHAKFINIIASEYAMEIIMLAIPMVVYGIYTKVGFLFYMYMAIILLILPVIPIMITSIIIAVIMRFTNRIKNKNKVMYVTIVLTILLVGFVTSSLNSGKMLSVSKFENIILKANGLAESIANYFVLIKPIMNTLLNYNNIQGFQNLILYILESILVYIVFLEIMSKIYFKGAIGTTINSNRNVNNFRKQIKLKELKAKNKYKSYISKELKTMIRTPIFCIECLILPIAYPTFVFGILAFFINLANKIGINVLEEVIKILQASYGIAIFLSIGQVFFMMNFASIIAISRESKNAILMKYLPIDLKKQFNLKLNIGIMTNTISSVLVSTGYYICTKNITNTVMFFIILMLLNLICEKFKLLIDLKKPQINWDSEYTMMKQNTNVMYELFYTILIIGILVAVSFVVPINEIYIIITFVVTFIINILINNYVSKNKNKIFKNVF